MAPGKHGSAGEIRPKASGVLEPNRSTDASVQSVAKAVKASLLTALHDLAENARPSRSVVECARSQSPLSTLAPHHGSRPGDAHGLDRGLLMRASHPHTSDKTSPTPHITLWSHPPGPFSSLEEIEAGARNLVHALNESWITGISLRGGTGIQQGKPEVTAAVKKTSVAASHSLRFPAYPIRRRRVAS
jgi:hypothetical protein